MPFQYLPTLFLGLLLLKSNEKVVEASSALYFPGSSHTNSKSHCKSREALDSALVHL